MSLFQLNNQSLPAQPSSYSPAPTSPPPSCSGDQNICTINATDNGSGQPILDVAILSEMVTALNNHSNTSNVSLKDA